MHILSLAADVILALYVIWQVVRFMPEYRQLKADVAKGDTQARMRVYRKAIVFEWVSALLALVGLGFDWSKLNPQSLDLSGTSLAQLVVRTHDFDGGILTGVFFGVAIGTIAIFVARKRANQRGATAARNERGAWLRKLIPDFSALIPSTSRERLVWLFVAISAGICEEIVFRGWLLSVLHNPVGLAGTALIAAAALSFGMAHAYQGITGMILTAFAGALFCALYLATGSLLVPIVLHVVIDARFALMPGAAPKPSEAIA